MTGLSIFEGLFYGTLACLLLVATIHAALGYFDRCFQVYALLLGCLGATQAYLWSESLESRVRFAELACITQPDAVRSVWLFGDAHPCSVVIDQHRWPETQGLGFFPDGGALCLGERRTAARELRCGEVGYVRPVPMRESRWQSKAGTQEWVDAVNEGVSSGFHPWEASRR